MPDRKLIAWIEPRGDQHVAAFVGKPVAEVRLPAMQACPSHQHAREWIEAEASAFGLPVEWVNDAPSVDEATRLRHARAVILYNPAAD